MTSKKYPATLQYRNEYVLNPESFLQFVIESTVRLLIALILIAIVFIGSYMVGERLGFDANQIWVLVGYWWVITRFGDWFIPERDTDE